MSKWRLLPTGAWSLAAAMVVAACGAAQAQDVITNPVNFGTYVSLAGGVNFPTDSTMSLASPITAPAQPRDVAFGTGWEAIGAVGYKWNFGIRTELEVNYRQASVTRFDTAIRKGDQGILGFSGNALYDIAVMYPVSISLGGGVGMGRNTWSHVNPINGVGPAFDGHSTNLQWQAIAEVNVPLNSWLSAVADYRYIGLSGNSFTGTDARITGDDRSHNILLGLRLYFNPAG